MKVLIIEDEGIVALGLEETLSRWGYNVVGITDNGAEALQLVANTTPDLALIDIHIKGAWDGIETAGRIRSIADFPIIYITAFSDRESIERAKETFPSAYLIKPYQEIHLQLSIEMAINNFAMNRTADPQNTRIIPLNHPAPAPKNQPSETLALINNMIFVKQNNSFVKVVVESIQILEADGNYTHLHTPAKKHTLRTALNTVLEKLSAGSFIRVHRSFAVNITAIDTFSESSVRVGNKEIPIGRSYKDSFLKHFDVL